jgi:hypothetical protein
MSDPNDVEQSLEDEVNNPDAIKAIQDAWDVDEPTAREMWRRLLEETFGKMRRTLDNDGQ